ncbi:hypothetical protein [Brevundimonas aurifodinae]|uniref:Uncharacterized protein n=2 Tax=Brevundimonas TaxID=41275 RepID=A0ABV1NLW5_9CAUL|nr:MAG: hypothetical protein B7Z01_00370 [Brevundimonas subvibrioides]
MAVTPTDPAQRRPSRRTRLALAAAAVGLTVAGTAQAQHAAPTGPRYLSWANRTTSTTPADIAAARVRRDIIPRRVAPSRSLARPAMQPFNPPMPVTDGGLTPASAWIGPRVAPAFAPGVPDPLSYATTEMAAAPVRAPPPAPVTPVRAEPAPPPPPASSMVQPTYASAPPPSSADGDPIAPRRDAPIFRLQSQRAAADGAAVQPPRETTEAAPVQLSPAPTMAPASGQPQARYYSVHRAAGRQPDPTVIPEPVFFDSVALDLAAPPDIQQPTRDAQGRRAPVPNADPSLP